MGERKKPDEERFSRMIHKSLLESIYHNFVIGSKIVFPENIEFERHFCKKNRRNIIDCECKFKTRRLFGRIK